MKIAFIKPNIGRMPEEPYVDEARMEPLQLGVLAGMTPEDIEAVMYDDRMEEIPYDKPADLVAITVETFTAKRAYEISEEFGKRGIPVIMGGMHPTLIPEEVSQHADSILIGDAETVWQGILEDANSGKLQRVYHGEPGEPQPGVLTRRDIFEGKGYLPISLMQFSRGCIYNCNFCASSVYFKRSHHCRKISEVIREIEEHGLKLVFFVDDNIVVDRGKAKQLFRALMPLRIKWVSQASIDMVQDPELMDLMIESGCLGHVIGFESIDIENLRSMRKSVNVRHFDSYNTQVEVLRDYGLQTWAAFTIGHEYDTADTIKRLLEFAIENKFTFAAFNILMPYPNTPFYDRLKAENRLLYDGKWWLHPDYRFNHAVFIPGLMTPEELTSAASMARRKFNSFGSVIKRVFDFKTNMRSLYKLAIYFQYNPLFRKEMYKKEGLIFGKSKGGTVDSEMKKS